MYAHQKPNKIEFLSYFISLFLIWILVVSITFTANPYAKAIGRDESINTTATTRGAAVNTHVIAHEIKVGTNLSSFYTVAVNPTTNMIYVTNFNSTPYPHSTISVIDGKTNSVVKTITVKSSYNAVAVNPNTNMVYVTHSFDNSTSVIDGKTNSVVKTIPVGYHPGAVAVNPNTNMVYVTNDPDKTVSVIDGKTNSVVKTITVGKFPVAVAVNPNTNMVYVTNRVYVTNGEDNTISVIDGKTNSIVKTIHTGYFPNDIAVNPNTNRVYVTNVADNTTSVIDGKTNSVVKTIPVGYHPGAVAVNPNTNMVYVTNDPDKTVSVIDGKTNSVVKTITVHGSPAAVAVNPNTNMAYITYGTRNIIDVIDGNMIQSTQLKSPVSQVSNTTTRGASQPSLKLTKPTTTNNQTTTNSTTAPSAVTVSILQGSLSSNNSKFYDPSPAKISLGGTVTWINKDTTTHTVTSFINATKLLNTKTPISRNVLTNLTKLFNSKILLPGQIFQHEFDSAGTFDYYCTIHPFMTGQVIVISPANTYQSPTPKVNNTPIALAGKIATDENQAVSFDLKGIDTKGRQLTFSIEKSPSSGYINNLQSNGPDSAEITYIPKLSYNGSDSFTFNTSNGVSVSSPASVLINVRPIPLLKKVSNLSTYENSTYGISSIKYPSDWTVNETNTKGNDSSAFDVVSFYPPPNSYLPGQQPPFVRISIDAPTNPHVRILVSNLSSYLKHSIDSYSYNDSSYTTINSNTTAKLAGFPAYSLDYSSINPDYNSTYSTIELGTIIPADKALYVDYSADRSSFSASSSSYFSSFITFLPTALKIINSLRINESAIAQLTPLSSHSPSKTAAATNFPPAAQSLPNTAHPSSSQLLDQNSQPPWSLTVRVDSHPFGQSSALLSVTTQNGYHEGKWVSTVPQAIWTFNIPADQGDQVQVCASGSSLTDRLGLGPQNCRSFVHVAGSGDITFDIDVP